MMKSQNDVTVINVNLKKLKTYELNPMCSFINSRLIEMKWR